MVDEWWLEKIRANFAKSINPMLNVVYKKQCTDIYLSGHSPFALNQLTKKNRNALAGDIYSIFNHNRNSDTT